MAVFYMNRCRGEGKMCLKFSEKKRGRKMRFRDVEEAFENAIKTGIEEIEKYMYMFSDDSFDYFKHIETREYEKVANDTFSAKNEGINYTRNY